MQELKKRWHFRHKTCINNFMTFHLRSFFIALLLTLFSPAKLLYAEPSPPERSNMIESLLSEGTLAEGDKVIQTLVRKYPPKKYVYVFVGRSLSVIQMQMEAKGHSTLNLPISGKEFHPEAPSYQTQSLNKQILETVDLHLGHLQDQNKSIVLVDFSSSGQGMKVAVKILNYFFNDLIKVRKFEIMAGDVFGKIKKFKRFFEQDFIYALKDDSRLLSNILEMNYKFLAPFPSLLLDFGHYKGFTSEEVAEDRALALQIIKKRQARNAGASSLKCSAFTK